MKEALKQRIRITYLSMTSAKISEMLPDMEKILKNLLDINAHSNDEKHNLSCEQAAYELLLMRQILAHKNRRIIDNSEFDNSCTPKGTGVRFHFYNG